LPAPGAIGSLPVLGAGGGCASRFAPPTGALPFNLAPPFDLVTPFDRARACDFAPAFDLAPACDLAPGAGFGFALAPPFGFPAGFVRPFARGPGGAPAFGPGAPFACPFACPRGAAFAPRSAFQGFAGGPRFTGVTFVA
jgi:hypothetical protein